MHTTRDYRAIRRQLARRKKVYLTLKERREMMRNLSKGMKDFILEQKKSESVSAQRLDRILLNA